MFLEQEEEKTPAERRLLPTDVYGLYVHDSNLFTCV